MRKILEFSKNFALKSDMFAAQSTLRYNGSSSYQTTFGGCLSILLVLSFVFVFGKSFLDVINKVNVSASLNTQDNPYDSSQISGIKLAIGIAGLDFSLSQRYFNIILMSRSLPLGGMPSVKIIKLSPCQKDNWKDYGEQFQKLFDVYSMNKMLCPSQEQTLKIKGFAGSDQWDSLTVLVQKCINQTNQNWTCYPDPVIKSKINTVLVNNDFFKVNFLVLNSIISPQQQNAVKNVLQNQIFITFSNTSGTRSQIKLAKYYITTDNSIWPFSQQFSQEGYYLSKHQSYTINLYSSHYVRVQIQKSREIFQIERKHQKLDQMLSYVGGLFSLLFGWLFFFIGSYNQYKYQIGVAEHSFAMDQLGFKIRENDFGFIKYLRYTIYDWLRAFNIPVTWPQMQEIHLARQEANEQMDVKYLMKRLQNYEKINKLVLGEHNLILANLTRPPSLKQVKKLRKIAQYYDKVIKQQIQQSLLKNILNLSNTNSHNNQIFNLDILNKQQNKFQQGVQGIKQNQNKTQKINETELDSQDQEIQIEILQKYKDQYNGLHTNSDQLSHKIFNLIPQSIKNRFQILQAQSKEKKAGKLITKIKVQQAVQFGQNTPNSFLSFIIDKQNK